MEPKSFYEVGVQAGLAGEIKEKTTQVDEFNTWLTKVKTEFETTLGKTLQQLKDIENQTKAILMLIQTEQDNFKKRRKEDLDLMLQARQLPLASEWSTKTREDYMETIAKQGLKSLAIILENMDTHSKSLNQKLSQVNIDILIEDIKKSFISKFEDEALKLEKQLKELNQGYLYGDAIKKQIDAIS